MYKTVDMDLVRRRWCHGSGLIVREIRPYLFEALYGLYITSVIRPRSCIPCLRIHHFPCWRCGECRKKETKRKVGETNFGQTLVGGGALSRRLERKRQPPICTFRMRR